MKAECPGCGADLTALGSVEASEQHALRGFVRFDAAAGDFTDLPLFDGALFADISYDEIQEESHACRACGTPLRATLLAKEED